MQIRKLTLIILSILGFFCCLEVKAQVGEYRNRLSVGVNGGVTMSSMDFDPTIKQGLKNSPTFGVTLRYTCEKYFATLCALQLELNYAQLGWKEEILNSYGAPLPDTYERSLNYIQLPMLARLSWGKEKGGLMFYIMAGPQLACYVGESAKQSEEWTLNPSGNPDRPNNVYQQYNLSPQNSFEYGLTGGLGIEFTTRKGQHFSIDGRYYYGLSDIYKNGKVDPFARSANTTIVCRFTYLFDLFDKNK